MHFPHDLWRLIKEYMLDFRKSHSLKLGPTLKKMEDRFGEIYTRWTHFPPCRNTNDILNDYALFGVPVEYCPRPNLELTSLTCENGVWWVGYGWEPKYWPYGGKY